MFQLVVHQWYQWCHWFSQQSEKKLKMIVTLGSSKSEQQSIWTTVRVEILKSQSHAVNITTCSGPTFVENATFLFRFHSQYIRFQCVISVHFWVWAYISRYAVGKTLKQIRKNKPSKIVFFFNVFFHFAWWHCFLACTCVWNVSSIFACDFRMVLVVYVPFLVKKNKLLLMCRA